MKIFDVGSLLLLTLLGACATPPTARDADLFETTMPEDIQAKPDAVPAAHTLFVPLAPEGSFVPLDAHFDLCNDQGKTLGVIRLVRSGSRVFAGSEDVRTGWFFLQNSLSPAQFKGWRIDATRKLLLEYQHSDLVNEGIAHSWDEVASLGIDGDLLRGLRATGEVESKFATTFRRYVRIENGVSTPSEVWWSDELRVPLRIVRDGPEGGGHTQLLTVLQTEVDQDLLQLPSQRFADFEVVDIADWRDDHHDQASQVEPEGKRP